MISPTSRIQARAQHPRQKKLGLYGAVLATGALVLGSFALPATGASQFADVDRDSLETHSGRLEIKQDGTVIDGLLVKGYIDIKADDVTIKNTIVEGSGANAVRVYQGAEGATISNVQVFCDGDRTNGIVHGDYTADRVDLFDCRHDFLFSDARPATITNSSIDGVAYSNVSAPAPTPSEEPTQAPVPGTTPSPEPTPTPTPTPTPAPTPTPSPTPTPAPSEPARPTDGFPNASNTGVQAGVTLRSSGSITVTEPGTVIENLDINGSVDIQADNVTIRNSRIATGSARYPVRVHSGVTGTLIEHVEIDGMGNDGKGIYFNGGSGTIRYSNIHSSEDGIFITADDVTVEYNYVHNMIRDADAHPDTIQIRGGDNITIRGNTLQAIHPQTGVSNAAIQIGSLVGDQINNLRVVDNYMNGGRFTINGGGRGEVASATYSGNRFGRDHQYGVAGNIENSVWDSSNVYHDNGQPAR